MSWRPWYHSLRALQLHKEIRLAGPLFRPCISTPSFKSSQIPPSEVNNFRQYQDNPHRYPHYSYSGLTLVPLSDEHYILGVSGQVTDFLPREIVKNDVSRWFTG
jgi:hypothetical protein